VDTFFENHVPALSPRSKILDLGGNKINKRGLFDIESYDYDVIYLNISPTKIPHILGNANNLPIKDGCFDAIICAELLEHVPDPPVVLSEMNRVLTNSGYLLITSPFLYRLHGDPSDYARYTGQYWSMVLARSGFDPIVIENQGSFFSVCLDFVKQYFNETRSHPLRDIYQILSLPLQKWVHLLERSRGRGNQSFIDSFTTGYGIIARKGRST
jgi:SAM-dependent methyltransferase